MLDLVAGLVERSLVQVIPRESSARYRLWEMIRMYARQRLSELEDPDRLRARHLEFRSGSLSGRRVASRGDDRRRGWRDSRPTSTTFAPR